MRRWWGLGLGLVALAVGGFLLLDGESAEGIVIEGYFSDDNGLIFEADIDAIAAADVTRGCNPPANDRYCPGDDVTRGQMAAFLRRALGLPIVGTDYFVDDDDSVFEADINAIAAADITRGCNPPANNRFCPTQTVTRGQMAAFLRRALGYETVATDYFVDDDLSVFEADINAIAAEDVTRGCNPPANDRYCPSDGVTRAQMAAFLRRGIGFPAVTLSIPVGEHPAMACSKDGERCTLTVDLSAGRTYRVQEGWFQVLPASAGELADLSAGGTSFALTEDGATVGLSERPLRDDDGLRLREWRASVAFTPGTHTLVGRWRWDGELALTTTITIRAAG